MILEFHPMRTDITNSKFILDTNIDKIKENQNYVVLSKSNQQCYYIQAQYKTQKTYGNNKINLNEELYKYIAKLFNYYNNKLKIKDKWFLYQLDNIKPLNNDNFSRLYKNIGIDILKRPISIQINRTQQASQKGAIIEELKEDAKAQQHSFNTHTRIYYKKGLKSKIQ